MNEFHSKNFTLAEFLKSGAAERLHINNGAYVTPDNVVSIANLVTNVLQPVRDKLGFPITVTSGFRCKQLNSAIGGVSNSQHMKGEAADLQVFTNKAFDVKKTRALFTALSEMDVDQLLYERGSNGSIWVHVSYVSPARNRHMIRDNYFAK